MVHVRLSDGLVHGARDLDHDPPRRLHRRLRQRAERQLLGSAPAPPAAALAHGPGRALAAGDAGADDPHQGDGRGDAVRLLHPLPAAPGDLRLRHRDDSAHRRPRGRDQVLLLDPALHVHAPPPGHLARQRRRPDGRHRQGERADRAHLLDLHPPRRPHRHEHAHRRPLRGREQCRRCGEGGACRESRQDEAGGHRAQARRGRGLPDLEG
mmetsp:Transcript_2492/g.6333  ORF Transcript_2492/g.6333 Transcript_2492/m.6333 type:complete len:210 (+) Transcript_2492:492-1121(+)